METILQKVEYEKHQWRICCDLKVVAMLCGLQGGYTKYMCFMCNWDSRFKQSQYDFRGWEARGEPQIGEKNVIRKALVPKENILLPPLHVKLGIVKSFIKTIAQRPEVVPVLYSQIYKEKISVDKIKNGTLNGPDIRKLISTENAITFENILVDHEKRAWNAIKKIIAGFFGKHPSETYEQDVTEMLNAFKIINVNMSLKIHFLHFHLDYFGRQLASESDEQGERFHQISMPFELR